MTKEMAGRVLRTGIAKMRAESDEGQCHITLRPVPDRHAGEQEKTAAMQELVAQLCEAGAERGQDEISGGQRCRAALIAACAITLVSPIGLPRQPGIQRDPDLAAIGVAERKR
jgi:ABC-type dipeptide/oligopeptide/nickel transport system ATPase subunit